MTAGVPYFGAYASLSALEAARPAASNFGAVAWVGTTQYTSNGVSWAATVAAPWNRSALAAIGDSRMAQAYYAKLTYESRATAHNFLPVARALLGGRLVHEAALNFAQSGFRSDQYTAAEYMNAAKATTAYWLLIGGVVNDIAATADAVDYWTAYVRPAVVDWLATGRGVIVMTETGADNQASTPAAVLAVNRYNRALRSFAEANDRVLIFDAAKVSRNPTAACGVRASHSGDGVHVNLYDGVMAQAQEFASLIGPYLPRVDPLPDGAGEVYANGGWQWNTNPVFASTTGGATATNITGTVPAGVTGWGGDAAAVAIAVSTSAGTHGNDMVLTCTASAAGRRTLQMELTGVAVESPGDVFRGLCEVSIDAGHSNLRGLPWGHIEANRGGSTYYSASAESVDNTHEELTGGQAIGPILLDTGPLVIPPGSRGWLMQILRVAFSDAGSATIRVRRIAAIRA